MTDLKGFLLKTLLDNGLYAKEKQKDFLSTEIKSDATLVTEIDLKVSDNINKVIKEYSILNNLDFSIIDEEKSPNLDNYLNSEYSWIIDPIDGTVNYSLNFPLWGVSIGLFKNMKPYAGGIYIPVLKILILTDNEKVYLYNFEDNNLEEYEPNNRNLSNNVGINYIVNMTNKSNKGFRITEGMVTIMNAAICNLYFTITGSSLATIQSVRLWDNAACFSIGNKLGYKAYNINNQKEIIQIDGSIIDTKFQHKENFVYCKEENKDKIFSILTAR